MHMVCCLLQLLSTLTQVELPYRLSQRPLGFEIHDSSNVRYPLYLLTEAQAQASYHPEQKWKDSSTDGNVSLAIKVKLKTLHVIRFEQAVVLLDQNIQYLLFNFRQPLHEQPSRTSEEDCLLNVDRLMRNCVRAMARGQPYPVDKIDPC